LDLRRPTSKRGDRKGKSRGKGKWRAGVKTDDEKERWEGREEWEGKGKRGVRNGKRGWESE